MTLSLSLPKPPKTLTSASRPPRLKKVLNSSFGLPMLTVSLPSLPKTVTVPPAAVVCTWIVSLPVEP